MTALSQDIRYALRMLAKSRLVSGLVVVTLALGIGGNCAVFSLVHGVILSPLPFPDSNKLTYVFTTRDGARRMTSGPDYLDLKQQSDSIDLCAFSYAQFNLIGVGDPREVRGLRVTTDFLDVMGIQPQVGRSFLAEEGRSGSDRVAFVTHGFWQNHCGGDPSILGKEIILDGEPFQVVGIGPRDLGFLAERANVFVPIPQERLISDRGTHHLLMFGRLRQGATMQKAQQELASIAQRLAQTYSDTNQNKGVAVHSLQSVIVEDYRSTLWMLYAAVGFVLLIACANIAALVLSRAGARRKEIAIRCALGATRGRIVTQVLTECVMLALLGGGLGMVLATGAINAFVSLGPGGIPGLSDVRVDGAVVAYTLLLSLATGVLFGLIPAFRASRSSMNSILREGGRRSASGAHQRVFSFAVTAELALSLVLLLGAGLAINSLLRLQHAGRGFDPSGVLAVDLKFSGQGRDGRIARTRELMRQVESLPGVESVGAVNIHPMANSNWNKDYTIEGQPPAPAGQRWLADYRQVDRQYFRTAQIPLVQGRYFAESDGASGGRVCIVNTALADRHFPDREALGRRVILDGKSHEIVGVVGNVSSRDLAAAQGVCPPRFYQPAMQTGEGSGDLSVLVRATGDPGGLVHAIQQEIWRVDSTHPRASILTLDQWIGDYASPQRFATVLLGALAGFALLLSATGIYGVMAYSVSRRTHEIGIRMALGARGVDVLKTVMGRGCRLTLIGAGIGLAGAAALAGVVSGLLYEVSPMDPLTVICVSLLLIAVALLASYVPARRAARIDPMEALRCE